MADEPDESKGDEDIGYAATIDKRSTQLDETSASPDVPAAAHPTPASSRRDDGADGRGRGDILEGVYEVIDVLSEAGGMARVFLARDLRLGRQVVVKMTRSSGFDAEKRALFEREARATARLKHRNIVTIHAFGFWGDSPYMVLEYLEGQSLRERLEQSNAGEAEAIRTMIPLARALNHAHERGVYHRDIKPDNIFLEDSGEVKLLDFGISDFNLDKQAVREALEGGADELIDGTPAVAGTPGFMAPEQWRGQSQDARTDVWGIGATLYCMLGGECPYPPQVPTRLFTQGVPSIQELCPDLQADAIALIDQCLKVDPDDRFDSANALLDALEDVRDRLSTRGEITGSPYRYLQPFEEGEEGWFFGRDAETARLARLVESNPLTALIGPSGAGKSSLVRAGLLPKLRERGTVHVLHVRPENRPLRRLRTELEAFTDLPQGQDEASLKRQPGLVGRLLRNRARADDARVLLLVDQLEELFTGDVEPDERQAFVDAIASASDDPRSRVRVVATMREDFLSRLAAFPTLQRRVTENLLLLGAPDREAQREMLVGPAERLGYAWPDDIVDRILAQVGDDPTPLPSLQIAASRCWELRDEDEERIPDDALERIGGVGGALSSHADEVVDRIQGPAQLRIAREIFCILVGREETRRAMPRDALLERFIDGEKAEAVLEHLISGRLIAVSSFEGATTVELAHDALIDRWDRLERWLRDDAESSRLRERLAEAARHWDTEGRPSELLWEGETLRRTLEWEDADARDLSVVEHDFLEDSRQAIDRRTWIRRYAFIAAFVVVGGAFYFIGAHGEEQKPDYTDEYESAAAQLLTTEPDLAAAFALRSLEADADARAGTLLHQALRADHLVQRHGVEAGVRDAVFSRVEAAYVTVPNSGFSLPLRNLGDGENTPIGVQGKLGAASSFDRVGTLFHRRNEAVHGIWCEQPEAVRTGALERVWAAGGRCRFPSMTTDRRRVELVTLEDGEVDRETIGGEWADIEYVSLSPDGRHLMIVGERSPDGGASSETKRRIEVFWTTGEPHFDLATPSRFVLARFVPGYEDAVLVAQSEADGGTRVTMQPAFGEEPVEITVNLEPEDLDARVAPRSSRIVLHNAAGHARVISLTENQGFVEEGDWVDVVDVDFLDDSTLGVLEGVRLRLVWPGGEVSLRHEAPVLGWRATESGERVVTWTSAGLHLWSTDGTLLEETVAAHAIRGVSTRDDGRYALVVTDAGTELHELWGRPEGPLLRLDERVQHVRFALDSKSLAAADASGKVRSSRLDGSESQTLASSERLLSLRWHDGELELLSRSKGALAVSRGGETRAYDLPDSARVERADWDLSGDYVWATGSPSFLVIWKLDDGERTVFRLDKEVREARVDGYSGWFFLVTGDSQGRAGSINGALNPPIEWRGTFHDLVFDDRGMCVGSVDSSSNAILTRFSESESETELDVDGVRDLAFSPDGSGLATIDRTGSVVAWTLEGKRRRELGYAPGAKTVEYSPDGSVVAATRPGATWLWDAKTGHEIARLPAGSAVLTYDHFSPDSRFLALPDERGAVELYALQLQLLRDIAKGQVVRDLSAADYARFGLPDPVFDRE
jgi:serine/threonine protein kinase/WD40 repeat protein